MKFGRRDPESERHTEAAQQYVWRCRGRLPSYTARLARLEAFAEAHPEFRDQPARVSPPVAATVP